MRNAYIAALYDLSLTDDRIVVVVADNGAIVYDKFRQQFPDRFINVGITEANMVSLAAGLANCGKIPFAYTISGFLTMRAFEQVRNDVCLQKTNVKLVGIGAGFVYSDLGPTHHATEDITLMRSLPGMTILAPADPIEAKLATRAAAQINGPVYLRLATGGTPAIYRHEYDFQVGRAVTLRQGDDITIISTGTAIHEVMAAAQQLQDQGVSARIINMHTLKPIDQETILQAASQTPAILTVEEHTVIGGLGSAVAEVLAEQAPQTVRFQRMGLQGVFPTGYGTLAEMRELNGLSHHDIARTTQALVAGQVAQPV